MFNLPHTTEKGFRYFHAYKGDTLNTKDCMEAGRRVKKIEDAARANTATRKVGQNNIDGYSKYIMRCVPANCPEPEWFRMACRLAQLFGEEGRQVFHEWSATAGNLYDYDRADRKYDNAMGRRK